MAKRQRARPTDAELAILRVLCRLGPSTERAVNDALERRVQRTGYTTALKQLQIMAVKGLVDRDESQRSHVYRARFSAGDTQRQLVGDLMNRAFGGSAERLVMQALASKRARPEEVEAIRQLLDELEKQGGKS